MNVKSDVLESVFRPYYSAVEHSRRGELFSRRADDGPAEEFFHAISMDEHFGLLEFQLQVQRALHSSGGWHVSINVLLAEPDIDRPVSDVLEPAASALIAYAHGLQAASKI